MKQKHQVNGAASGLHQPTARSLGLLSCHCCNLLVDGYDRRTGRPLDHHRCPRCGARLHQRKPDSLSRTAALVLAAMILYLPANLLPITITTTLGKSQADTILSGVIFFIQTGSWGIGSIIFIASVFVPMVKLLILILLLLSVHLRWHWCPGDRTILYRLTELVGRWSMVDIFVITILVAMVKLGFIATIEAGPAAVYFGAVVVITMFAAHSFDPRLIWDLEDSPHKESR